MGKYFSSKDFIEIYVLSIALFVLFFYSLKDFIVFMKNRRRFYEEYISCFHFKEENLFLNILNFAFILFPIIMVITIGKDYVVNLEKESFFEIILYVTLTILSIGLMVLNLISTYIHMKTDYGISSEYISVNSLILPKDKVVYEECEDEIIIYRKSRNKEKGVKLVSQAYDIGKDQKFIDCVHANYEKVKPSI
jgi:hypothetical protein